VGRRASVRSAAATSLENTSDLRCTNSRRVILARSPTSFSPNDTLVIYLRVVPAVHNATRIADGAEVFTYHLKIMLTSAVSLGEELVEVRARQPRAALSSSCASSLAAVYASRRNGGSFAPHDHGAWMRGSPIARSASDFIERDLLPPSR